MEFSRYMKRLISDLPKPTVGLNCGEGLQATAVAKLLKEGGTLLNCGKSLPQDVTYPGADRRPLKWDDLLKARKLNVKSVWGPIWFFLLEPNLIYKGNLRFIRNESTGHVRFNLSCRINRIGTLLSYSTWNPDCSVKAPPNEIRAWSQLCHWHPYSGMGL